MATEILLTLKSGQQTPMGYRFAPDDTVKGTVQILPDKDLNCRHLYVRLQWHTEGRGDRDSAVVGEQDLFQGTLSGGMPTYHDFSLTAPRGPWSYSGHYINIVWEVIASIDVPMGGDPKAEIPFILSPEGR